MLADHIVTFDRTAGLAGSTRVPPPFQLPSVLQDYDTDPSMKSAPASLYL